MDIESSYHPEKFANALPGDLELLRYIKKAADNIKRKLEHLDNWGPSGKKTGQYCCDLVADEAALEVLLGAGLDVFSEESGLTRGSGLTAPSIKNSTLAEPPPGSVTDSTEPPSNSSRLVAVLDPVDGSTNASRRIPWWATSIAIVDEEGPRVALVVNQATGKSYETIRGQGAFLGAERLRPSNKSALSQSIIGVSGYPSSHFGWNQFRALGAAALDLASVAEGVLDGYLDCTKGSLAPWDYLGGYLLCLEAGAYVSELHDRDLFELEYNTRRAPIAASTPQLLDELTRAARL